MFERVLKILQSRVVAGVMLAIIVGLPLLWVLPLRGLLLEYYGNTAWGGEPLVSQRVQSFDLKTIHRHHEKLSHTNFSARWSGWIRIDRAGEYTFSTASDDGSSLFINGAILVENGGFHAFRKRTGQISLSKGLHLFQVNYVQGAAAYDLKVYWSPPGKSETFIPASALYPMPFPVRGIGFVTRHFAIFYAISWLFFLLILLLRFLERNTGKGRQALKTVAQNVALSCGTILVILVTVEGIIRIIAVLKENRQDMQTLLQESQETTLIGEAFSLKGMIQPSKHVNIVYELKPHLHGSHLNVPLTTNSQGLRDREYDYQKPDDTFRIVGLGDSSMFGWGVRQEESLLEILETTLNEHSLSTRYEVINFAVPGYNTAIEVEVSLKKCLKYSPDLVIMHFNTNDYDVPYFMLTPQNYATLRKSFLLDFLISRYQQLAGRQHTEVIPFVFDGRRDMEETARLDEESNIPDAYRYMVGERGFIRAMERLMAETTPLGIEVLVYVVRSYPGLESNYVPNKFRTKQLELVTRLSEELNFSLLNMYPAYIAYHQQHPDADDKVFWVSKSDSHPNAIAHRVEAETMYQYLVKEGLLGAAQE